MIKQVEVLKVIFFSVPILFIPAQNVNLMGHCWQWLEFPETFFLAIIPRNPEARRKFWLFS